MDEKLSLAKTDIKKIAVKANQRNLSRLQDNSKLLSLLTSLAFEMEKGESFESLYQILNNQDDFDWSV